MTVAIDHTIKMPLRIQVENLMRQLINSPEYKNGALLPKEAEPANRPGVSRTIIRQVTNEVPAAFFNISLGYYRSDKFRYSIDILKST
ncbi:hypothetical protein D9M69_530770 [compost metagenome]